MRKACRCFGRSLTVYKVVRGRVAEPLLVDARQNAARHGGAHIVAGPPAKLGEPSTVGPLRCGSHNQDPRNPHGSSTDSTCTLSKANYKDRQARQCLNLSTPPDAPPCKAIHKKRGAGMEGPAMRATSSPRCHMSGQAGPYVRPNRTRKVSRRFDRPEYPHAFVLSTVCLRRRRDLASRTLWRRLPHKAAMCRRN